MKAEGWKFPPVREAEAMFEADIAPDWHDGECCHRCRVQVKRKTIEKSYFGSFFVKKHCTRQGRYVESRGYTVINLLYIIL
jgi:hypothetical protein